MHRMRDAPRTWKPPDAYSYSYLLGMYLGDGCVSVTRRTFRLAVSLDAQYEDIIESCVTAMVLTRMRQVNVWRDLRHRRVVVHSGWKRWPEVFPQHGPGRKHERLIQLRPWQREILDAHPQQFLRGLIESDGCRTINRFKVKLPSGRVGEYAYPRYFFSNLSADIRGLFCEYCDKLDIRWTQSNHRNISVAHRDSVARLDEFVGPKR